jgi:hypothetical protein
MTASARQRSRSYEPRVPHLPKPVAGSSSCDHDPCNRCGGQRLNLLQEQEGGGGRNARATSRACAFLEVSPRQFAFAFHRLPLALPQSSSQIRNSHVSLNPLSFTLL